MIKTACDWPCQATLPEFFQLQPNELLATVSANCFLAVGGAARIDLSGHIEFLDRQLITEVPTVDRLFVNLRHGD